MCLFFLGISPKGGCNIAGMPLRFCRKGIGIPPIWQYCNAEEATEVGLLDDSDSIVAFFRCCEVLKS